MDRESLISLIHSHIATPREAERRAKWQGGTTKTLLARHNKKEIDVVALADAILKMAAPPLVTVHLRPETISLPAVAPADDLERMILNEHRERFGLPPLEAKRPAQLAAAAFVATQATPGGGHVAAAVVAEAFPNILDETWEWKETNGMTFLPDQPCNDNIDRRGSTWLDLLHKQRVALRDDKMDEFRRVRRVIEGIEAVYPEEIAAYCERCGLEPFKPNPYPIHSGDIEYSIKWLPKKGGSDPEES